MSDGPTLDALLPEEVARKAEALGVAKARRDLVSLLTLSVLAGAFIALGAMFSTVVAAGLHDALPLGLSRVLPAIAFSLGLILVVVCGAEPERGWRGQTPRDRDPGLGPRSAPSSSSGA